MRGANAQGFGCYLDEEKLARSEGWHAYCMPLHNHSSTASDASDGLAPPSDNAVPTDLLLTAVKSRSAINAIRNFTMALRASPRLCEGASTIFCRSIIRQGIEKHASYREYVEKVVLKYEKEISPLTFAFIVCGSILALFLVLLIGGVQFHRVRNRAIQAELELQARPPSSSLGLPPSSAPSYPPLVERKPAGSARLHRIESAARVARRRGGDRDG